MNEIDLNHFQFERDLTFMSFFQDGLGRTYARYGGREDESAESHLTKKSLIKTMQTVLELNNKKLVQPISKYEPQSEKRFTPEQIPTMKSMMASRKEKCIHCHDVKNAQLKHLDRLGKLKKEMIFTYPSPLQLGISLDADDHTLVKKVVQNSAAAKSGVKRGDRIKTVDGQRVLTFGDFTRVLELAPKTGKVSLVVASDGSKKDVSLELTSGWRAKNADAGWRGSSGIVGPSSGFWGRKLTINQKKQLELGNDDLAVKVTFIWGQWTRNAGIRNGDVVVSIEGHKKDMTIRQLQAHLHLNHDWEEEISMEIMRGGKRRNLKMKLPKNKN